MIGNNYSQERTFNGWIDEVRISDTIRSADWINTSFNNQSTTTDFIKVQAEETGPGLHAFAHCLSGKALMRTIDLRLLGLNGVVGPSRSVVARDLGGVREAHDTRSGPLSSRMSRSTVAGQE